MKLSNAVVELLRNAPKSKGLLGCVNSRAYEYALKQGFVKEWRMDWCEDRGYAHTLTRDVRIYYGITAKGRRALLM